MAEIDAVLAERRKTHGDYGDHARVTQALKRVMEGEKGWARLNDCQREALAIIAHKIGRILSGNPDFADHWVDIGGYAKLVADRVVEQDRVNQSWANAAIKDKASWRGALTPLKGYTSEGLRAEMRELGRAPPSPVGEELAARIRAELERREHRPGSADAGAHHARQNFPLTMSGKLGDDGPRFMEPMNKEGGANDMKVGDRVICDTPGHAYYGRTGVAREFLQDGDAYVQLDGEQGYAMIKWNHLSKAP